MNERDGWCFGAFGIMWLLTFLATAEGFGSKVAAIFSLASLLLLLVWWGSRR